MTFSELSKEQSQAYYYLLPPLPENDFHNFNHINRVIFGGSAGGGKSVLISFWLDFMCMSYPGTRYYMARETLKDIKDSILLTYFEVVGTINHRPRYNAQNSIITYANGSTIYLLEVFAYPSDPNFDSLGSREYTAGAIEEGISVTKKAADILISRTRFKHEEFGLIPKQLITCNPGDGWIKDEIVIPQLDTGKPVKPNVIFIPASLHSNPNANFAKRYAQTLEENLTAFDRARLLEGDWNAKPKTGAEYFKEFNIDKHTSIAPYDPLLPLHITFDENVNPHITCQLWQIKPKPNNAKDCKQVGEICPRPPVNTRKRVCLEIIKKFPGHKAGMFIYGDSTSQKNETGKEYGENFFTDILEGLKEYHPVKRVPSKNPPVVSKGGFLNLIFEKNYRGISIQIDRGCQISISDYAYAMEDTEGGINKKKVVDPDTQISYEKYGHACDAMTYFICEAFLNDFNYYLSGGQSHVYEVGNDRDYVFERD